MVNTPPHPKKTHVNAEPTVFEPKAIKRLNVPCLKNAKKRIVINPLSSGFCRGYTGQERSIRPIEQEP